MWVSGILKVKIMMTPFTSGEKKTASAIPTCKHSLPRAACMHFNQCLVLCMYTKQVVFVRTQYMCHQILVLQSRMVGACWVPGTLYKLQIERIIGIYGRLL